MEANTHTEVVPVSPGEEQPAASPFSVICLSSQDWDVALPTNRQQIMSRTARRGHRVLFVETGGFIGRHLWRLVRGPRRRSLARRLTVGEEVAGNIKVRKLVAPVPFGQWYGAANRLNWAVGARAIGRAARRLPAPRVTWIYDPRAVEALGALGDAFGVYDCVDDYPEQAGGGRRRALVAAADRGAAARSRVVFATARPLYERHVAVNARTHLVANVGDFDHFAGAVDRSSADPELLDLPRPVLGFAGNLTASKVDFGILDALADAFSDGTLLVAGPAHGHARARLDDLRARSNVRWLGVQSYERLPRVIAAFDVALIPYLSNAYTRSCFPLKVYEYLAAGKPVVATGLPELAGLGPHVVLVRGAAEAVSAVSDAVEHAERGRQERIALAARNTWEARTTRLLELVQSELAG